MFTGAGYGHFDWFRLLTTVELFGDDPSRLDLVWPAKAALAIEEYIFARFYMYQNVYLHKTTRGFEQLLQAMWKRAATLMEQGRDIHAVPILADFWGHPNADPASLPLEKYFRIEEFTVLAQIDAWQNHPDKPLADLARRFLNRDGFARIPAPVDENLLESGGDSEWLAALADLVCRAGFDDPATYCVFDEVDGKYRRPYKPESQ